MPDANDRTHDAATQNPAGQHRGSDGVNWQRSLLIGFVGVGLGAAIGAGTGMWWMMGVLGGVFGGIGPMLDRRST